jgi:hypothetical protein
LLSTYARSLDSMGLTVSARWTGVVACLMSSLPSSGLVVSQPAAMAGRQPNLPGLGSSRAGQLM